MSDGQGAVWRCHGKCGWARLGPRRRRSQQPPNHLTRPELDARAPARAIYMTIPPFRALF